MKQALGPKQVKQLEQKIGRPIEVAFTRGGWAHNKVQVWFADEDPEAEVVFRMYDRFTGELLSEWFPNRR